MSDEPVSVLTTGDKLERKFLAHFINVGTKISPNYVRLGKDLEDYSIELNPDVETKKNILGEQSVNVKGYEPQGSVDTYYAYKGDPLFTKLYDIIKTRATGAALETSVIDALIDPTNLDPLNVTSATETDVVIVPQSMGGTDGIQIPFDIHYKGTPTAVTGTIANGVFTKAA